MAKIKVLLQFLEGIKSIALEKAKELEKEGYEVYVSSRPTFGACDLALEEAKRIGAKKIIHFGHNRFIKQEIEEEVEYVEYRMEIDEEKIKKGLERIKKLGYKKVIIVTTIQYSDKIKKMKEIAKSLGLTPLTSKGYWAREEGQILGCDVKAALIEEGEVVVFIGTGYFHSLAFYGINKPVFSLDITSGKIKELTKEFEKIEKIRKGMIAKAYESKRFAILVSTKIGQYRMAWAKAIKRELEKRGKEAIIVVEDTFSNSIENLDVEVYVNTACPRIFDDYERLSRPILNVDMVYELFNIIDIAKGKKPKFKVSPFYWIKE